MTNNAWRILVIEDNAGDRELLAKALSRAQTEFDVRIESNLAGGLAAMASGEWDVILTDLSLPDSNGLETVRRIREGAPQLPIVVLTSLASDEMAMRLLDEGAQDYLMKDTVTPDILDRAIRYAVQRQQNAEMRRMVARLRNSERCLEKKNRRLSRLYKTAHRFVDNVSHEFRTPLTVIKEYLSLLRDGVVGELNEEQIQMIDIAADRSNDLNNMVDDMLDISRLEAGMFGLRRQNCRISDIIRHVRPNLTHKSLIKQVDLKFEIPDDLPEVFCDDEKIGRVIVNLTMNAIKFSGQPGQVRMWAKFVPERREVVIGITDNGDGISPENLAAIFRRFKQVGSNPRGSTKGFGLGLNIARELVHLNLGEINVESTLRCGSTFWFTIPVAEPVEVMRRYLDRVGAVRRGGTALSLLKAEIPAECDGQLADEIHSFLNLVLGRNDLLIRWGSGRWLLATPCELPDLKKLICRIERMQGEFNRNRVTQPLPQITLLELGSWSVPEQKADIQQLVRESLSSSASGLVVTCRSQPEEAPAKASLKHDPSWCDGLDLDSEPLQCDENRSSLSGADCTDRLTVG